MQGQNDTVHVLENAKRLPYALVLNGLLVGVLAGGVAVIYRLLLEKGEAAMRWALGLAQDGLPGAAAWFLGLAVLGGVAGLLVRWEPLISGSGIPQVSGCLLYTSIPAGRIPRRCRRILRWCSTAISPPL